MHSDQIEKNNNNNLTFKFSISKEQNKIHSIAFIFSQLLNQKNPIVSFAETSAKKIV